MKGFRMNLPGPFPGYGNFEGAYAPAEQMWLATGVDPPWWCVWADGRDVTDQAPESWPWPYTKMWVEGWHPGSGPNADPPSAPGRRVAGMRAAFERLS